MTYRRIEVKSKRFACPEDEWHGRPGDLLNKFTTISMLNEIRWTFGRREYSKTSLAESHGRWYDLQLVPGARAIALDRAVERRKRLKSYFLRIAEADVVLLTLGLVEAWYDSLSDTFLNAPPPPFLSRQVPDRFRVALTGFRENLEWLEEFYAELCRVANEEKRVVVTVSPVPMDTTFFGSDLALANTYSKSTLRAVAGDFASNHPRVDYFPSFEIVSMTPRGTAYSPDCVQVNSDTVAAVVQQFLESYRIDAPREHPHFVEMEYLRANPDVYSLVRRGEVASGYEHWCKTGIAEGRPAGMEIRT